MADLDSQLAETVIEAESYSGVGEAELQAALRRLALDPGSGALVTFLGSAYTNVGVQPLLDAVTQYCPSPPDRDKDKRDKFGETFSGLVFKIVNHPQKGTLSFVRVYTGSLGSKDSVYNVNKEKTEKVGKLYIAFADQFREVGEVGAGNIVVVAGLKLTQTGDTLLPSKGAAVGAGGMAGALVGPAVPEPVVFCSVEPASQAEQAGLEAGLAGLAREDPSLQVRQDEETGQTVLGGMGELHLEIVAARLASQYRVQAELGRLEVGYREVPGGTVRHSDTWSRTVAGRQHSLTADLQVEPVAGGGAASLVLTREVGEELSRLGRLGRRARAGFQAALAAGPLLSFPVLDCAVVVHSVTVARGTPEPLIVAGCTALLRAALARAAPALAEPLMRVEVVTEEELVGTVVQDLLARYAAITGCKS